MFIRYTFILSSSLTDILATQYYIFAASAFTATSIKVHYHPLSELRRSFVCQLFLVLRPIYVISYAFLPTCFTSLNLRFLFRATHYPVFCSVYWNVRPYFCCCYLFFVLQICVVFSCLFLLLSPMSPSCGAIVATVATANPFCTSRTMTIWLAISFAVPHYPGGLSLQLHGPS